MLPASDFDLGCTPLIDSHIRTVPISTFAPLLRRRVTTSLGKEQRLEISQLATSPSSPACHPKEHAGLVSYASTRSNPRPTVGAPFLAAFARSGVPQSYSKLSKCPEKSFFMTLTELKNRLARRLQPLGYRFALKFNTPDGNHAFRMLLDPRTSGSPPEGVDPELTK
jgi:hypothetical protein